MTRQFVIGADIGGSHITCMAVDLENKQLVDEICQRQVVDCHATAGEILDTWADAILSTMKMIPYGLPGGIGFAMPGPFDYPLGLALFRGVRKYDNLYNVNIREELRERLSLPADLPVRFLNDATCFAVGEAWMGPASGYRKTVAVTLGTGFGSAFLVDGIPVEKGADVPEAGCLYHLPFGTSNADDHFSSRWFKATYFERLGKTGPGVKELHEHALTNPDIRGIFTDFGSNMGVFMAPWLKKFGCECLTLGGNIARSYDLFETSFRNVLTDNDCDVAIYLSELGEHAAIAGSARLTDDSFYSKLPFISNK
jgi:glucokinase